jgi:hypothetical protein
MIQNQNYLRRRNPIQNSLISIQKMSNTTNKNLNIIPRRIKFRKSYKKDKSQTSTNVPGAFDIPELRSDLGAAWDPPVGKRQRKPADKANMILEVKLEEMASTQIDYACMVTNGPKSMRLALKSTDSVHWRREIETEIGTLEGHKTWLVVNNLPSGKTAVTSRIVLQKSLGSMVVLSDLKHAE